MKWKLIRVKKHEWHRWFAWHPVTVEYGELDKDGEIYGVEKRVWLKTVWRKEWVTQWDWGYHYRDLQDK